MAARRSDDRGNGNSSLELVWVRLNGSDTTIERALNTVQTMRNPRPVIVAKPKVKELPDGKKNGDEQQPSLYPDPEDEQIDGEVVDSHDEEASPPGRGTGNSTTKRPPTRLPKGIPDLDFDAGTPTFLEFATEKKPKDQFDWYLLVASWLKKHKQIEEIGIRHIVTAKQYIGGEMWGTLSEDAGQPFRDGRRPQHGIFENGSKRGLSKITRNGEIRVERMGKS
jgi:hypothetical protein